MTDAQDILSGRLAQAQGILSSLLIDEQHDNMVSRELNNTLWAIDTLLDQAAGVLKEMPYVSKPQAPVMAFGEPIPDLEKELIIVMREMTKELEGVAVTGRGMLDDIDKRDKAAGEAPGGES